MQLISFIFLWLLVFIMPWEERFAIPELASSAKILGMCTLASTLAYTLFSARLRFSFALVWVALFTGWCFICSSWEILPEAAIGRTLTFAQLLILVWALCELADSSKLLKWLMRAFLFGTALMVANMYLNYAHVGVAIDTPEEVRFAAEASDANAFAYVCSVCILFAYHLMTRREKTGFELPNWFYWGFIVAAGLAIPLTGSRAGLLSGLIAGCALLLSLSKLSWRARLGLVVTMALVGVLVLLLVARSTFTRLAEGTSANTFQERWNAWVYGLKYWATTPDALLKGIGPGSYPELMGRMGYRRMVAHNLFVEVLVETGVVGFTLYCAYWASIIWRAVRLPKADRFLWLGVFATFLPAVLSGSAEYWKCLWFLGAMVLCQDMNNKAAAKNRNPAPAPYRGVVSPPLRLPGPPPLETGTDDHSQGS